MILRMIYCFIAVYGFGGMFYIPKDKLPYTSFGSVVASLFFDLPLKYFNNYYLALLISAMAFSFYSEICARKLKAPTTIFIFSALIPLVPGAYMYYTVIESITNNLESALNTGFMAFATAAVLAFGIIVISTLFKLYYQIKNHKIY